MTVQTAVLEAKVPTEETSTSLLGSAWNAVTQMVDEHVVQSFQAAFNTSIQTPESTQVADLLEENIPGMTKQEVENGLNQMNPIATLQTGDELDSINSWVAINGVTPIETTTPDVQVAVTQPPKQLVGKIDTINEDTYAEKKM